MRPLELLVSPWNNIQRPSLMKQIMEYLHPEEIIEEISRRKKKFKYLRFLSWIFLFIFFLLIVDVFFLKVLNLQSYGDYRITINFLLFFNCFWFNLHFIHDFLTDKMAMVSNIPFVSKFGFLGWNVFCLGHISGLINVGSV